MDDLTDPQESLPTPEPVQQSLFENAAEAGPAAHTPASNTPNPTKPGRATGPRTPSGKAKSAMNRLTHGCRSEKAVLPHEDPAEYQAMVQNWFDQYDPHDHDEITLVAETALAHWRFQRASKRLDDIESHLPGNAWNWTELHQHLFSNFSRYKTTAERSLIRWYRELEAYQGRELHFEQARENLRVRTASVELAWLKRSEKTLSADLKVKQLVLVEKKDGDSVVSYFPTNRQILDDINARPHKPLLLQRSIEFPNGVPPAYTWAHPDITQRKGSCAAVQRFFYLDWLKAISREEATGQIGPIGIVHPDSPSPAPIGSE